MLANEDIQHILLTRTPALTGRYEFLSFRNAAGGRAWLSAIREKAQSAAEVMASVEKDKRWVTVAFTWNGLRALGVDEESLATFPEEFKQGMVARAEMLGDTGENHPDNWVGGLASPDLHAIAILFARDAAERARCLTEHDQLVAVCEGVEVLSTLDLEATPPFDYAHDHFGYRDRLSQPVIEGTGEVPTPGTGAPLKAGEFILGYPDEDGPPANLPQPEILSRNGSYMAYRCLQEHVGRFRDFLREHGKTHEEQELIAAKLMGRWRSGAPLTLAPEKDDPALGADLQRNNDFNYKEMDPHGYAVPLPHAPNEPPRHGGEHEPPPHDPPRRHLRPAFAGGRAGGRRGARHRSIRDLREPDSTVRVRAKRLGERPEFSRARQRTRPDHRRSGRHARIQNSQASDPQKNYRLTGLHHCERRRLLLPPWHQGASIPRDLG